MSGSKTDPSLSGDLETVAANTESLGQAMKIVGDRHTGTGPNPIEVYVGPLNQVTIVARGGAVTIVADTQGAQIKPPTTPVDVKGGSIFEQGNAAQSANTTSKVAGKKTDTDEESSSGFKPS